MSNYTKFNNAQQILLNNLLDFVSRIIQQCSLCLKQIIVKKVGEKTTR